MDPLTQPLGAIARPIEPLHVEDSLERAAALSRGVTSRVVPIVDGDKLFGVVTEEGLFRALSCAQNLSDPLSSIAEPWISLPASATGAEAMRAIEAHRKSPIVVLDAEGHPIGLVDPSDLFARRLPTPAPPHVGGMATPFGVYLTGGTVKGGAGHFALVTTGMALFAMLLVASAASYYIESALRLPARFDFLFEFLPIAFFMAAMRLSPIAGTHAAEHQVVHALERGEMLTPEVVARMPRVHPRCGTNLAVAAGIFLGLFRWEWHTDLDLRFLVAALATVFLWKPVGSFVQWAITTRKANPRQLESGIHAAKELLDHYRSNRRASAHPMQRLMNSGLLHVMLGSSIAAGIAQLLSMWFKWPFLTL